MKQTGFTLIELAIALTVIALLAAGILLGGSAILESARTANLISEIKDLAGASRDFKNKYGYFPGDLPNAANVVTSNGGVSAACSYAASVSGVPSTVGNGLVDSATESSCAIEHLVRSGLVTKADLIGGAYSISHAFGTGNITLSSRTTGNSRENVVLVATLPCRIALQIDGKLDNESATPFSTGVVTALDGTNIIIQRCTPDGANDPVPFVLIQY